MVRICTIGIVLGAALFAAAAVKKGPYMVWNGTTTTMTVLWQFDTTQAGSIQWGATTNYGSTASTSEYSSDHQHNYTITGLTPGAKYYYNVQNVGSGSFVAAPSTDAQNVKFFVYGDTRSQPAQQNSVCGGMIASWTSDPQKQTIAILSGDWVMSGDLESSWSEEFFARSQSNLLKFQSEIPLCGPMGNHENYTGNLMNKYFPQPGGDTYYYSFDYGPVHIVVVNQYISYSPGSTQYNWIESDLAASAKPWKIMTYHEPAWTAGDHDGSTSAQNYLHPLCMQYGVDLTIAGHNHVYAHALKDGVHHITTGGGGAQLIKSATYKSDCTKVVNINYHFCEIEIVGNVLSFTATKSNGDAIDTFKISHVPSVTMTAPDNRVLLSEGSATTVSASVNTVGGDCSKVSFYANYGSGKKLIGEAAAEPWSISWTPSVSGADVALTAQADVTVEGSVQHPVSDTITVNISQPTNAVPVADAGSNQTVIDSDDNGSESVVLDGSASSDPDGTIVSWLWKEGETIIGSGKTFSASFTLGSHRVTLEVTDSGSKRAFDTITVNVLPLHNDEPVAQAGPDQLIIDNDGDSAENVTLDASGSIDRGGTIEKYEWDLNNDGAYEVSKNTGNPTANNSFSLGQHTVVLRVTDNSGATSTDTVSIEILEKGALKISTARVIDDADDAEEIVDVKNASNGSVTLNSTTLSLAQKRETNQLVGVRFTGVGIPGKASIKKAYIQFTCHDTGSKPTSLSIHGETVQDAAPFTNVAQDISSRQVTATSVSWNVPAWPITDESMEEQRTPDLSKILQEIVKEDGFSESSSLVFIFSGSGMRVAESFEGSPSASPIFHVEYTGGIPASSLKTTDSASRVAAIQLFSGWNMLSFNIRCKDSTIDTIFGNAKGVVLVKNGLGKIYWPAFGINTIGSIHTGEGYQVFASTTDTIRATGSPIAIATTPITLAAGWNMIGFLPDKEMDVKDAFSGIEPKITLVKNNDGEIYWPEHGINTIGSVKPGQGYQVHMQSPASLIYP
jgi:hypothetical protein